VNRKYHRGCAPRATHFGSRSRDSRNRRSDDAHPRQNSLGIHSAARTRARHKPAVVRDTRYCLLVFAGVLALRVLVLVFRLDAG
jgi:hypothetical protein